MDGPPPTPHEAQPWESPLSELAALRLRKAGHSGASGQTPNNLLQPQETSKMSFPEALALLGTAAALCAVLSCLPGGGCRISHCNET